MSIIKLVGKPLFGAFCRVFPQLSRRVYGRLFPLIALEGDLRANHFGTCLGADKVALLNRELDAALRVEGALIECGVFTGGSLFMIADRCQKEGLQRVIYALDSFEGFDPEEFQADKTRGWARDEMAVFSNNSMVVVQAKARRLKMDGLIRFVKGFFKNTLDDVLQRAPAISFAHIDCDLYEPVKFCAERILPKMVPGGIMLFDDLTTGYKGASSAFEEFTASLPAECEVAVEAGMGIVRIKD